MSKPPFKGILRIPIDPRKAKPGPLRAVVGLQANTLETTNYIREEIKKRLSALDRMFSLPSRAPDIWEPRAKAILSREFEIEPNASDWWQALTFALAHRYIPGFSRRKPNKARPGAPTGWTDLRFAQLLADVEFLKHRYKLSDRRICAIISSKKEYRARWRSYHRKPESLRKALVHARKRFKQKSFLRYFWAEVSAPGQPFKPIDLLIKKHAIKRWSDTT